MQYTGRPESSVFSIRRDALTTFGWQGSGLIHLPVECGAAGCWCRGFPTRCRQWTLKCVLCSFDVRPQRTAPLGIDCALTRRPR